MPAGPYDLILVGGGLANGLIAWRLHSERPELKILLLEAGDTIGGNHTWSFHDGDLDVGQRVWIAPLVGSRWPRYEVVFPDHARTLESGYASIASSDFARVISAALGQSLRTGAAVDALTPTRVRLNSGEVLEARAVIDGRGPQASSRLALGYQTFLGQEVRLRVPHRLTAPVIMDASVEQQGGYRFVYLLPFEPDRILIEDTHYVDTGAWEPERLRANIAAYARARGWEIAEVLREEHGSLPIVLAGDIDGFWDDLGGQPASGLRAGLFHSTTGYSGLRCGDPVRRHPRRVETRLAGPGLLPAAEPHAVFGRQSGSSLARDVALLHAAGAADRALLCRAPAPARQGAHPQRQTARPGARRDACRPHVQSPHVPTPSDQQPRNPE
jgi:lycopene beta-cyclase